MSLYSSLTPLSHTISHTLSQSPLTRLFHYSQFVHLEFDAVLDDRNMMQMTRQTSSSDNLSAAAAAASPTPSASAATMVPHTFFCRHNL